MNNKRKTQHAGNDLRHPLYYCQKCGKEISGRAIGYSWGGYVLCQGCTIDGYRLNIDGTVYELPGLSR